MIQNERVSRKKHLSITKRLCKGVILYGFFSAPKINYFKVVDENGVLSQKTTFKGYDQNKLGLNFKHFLDFRGR